MGVEFLLIWVWNIYAHWQLDQKPQDAKRCFDKSKILYIIEAHHLLASLQRASWFVCNESEHSLPPPPDNPHLGRGNHGWLWHMVEQESRTLQAAVCGVDRENKGENKKTHHFWAFESTHRTEESILWICGQQFYRKVGYTAYTLRRSWRMCWGFNSFTK